MNRWVSVAEAAAFFGVSVLTLEARVARAAVPNYCDSRGRRRVWIAPQADDIHVVERGRWDALIASLSASLARQSEEIAKLREELARGSKQREAAPPMGQGRLTLLPKSEAKRARPVAPRASRELPLQHKRILDRLLEAWPGSIRGLERHLGLSASWIHKAKAGKRSGPASRGTWARLAEVDAGSFTRAA